MSTTRVHKESEVLKDHQDQLDLEEVKVTQDPLVHLELLDNKEHLDCRVHLVLKETWVLREQMVHKDLQVLQDRQEHQEEIFLLNNQLTLKLEHHSSILLRILLTEFLGWKQLQNSLMHLQKWKI